jgi:large subunit ribosomal protein L10
MSKASKEKAVLELEKRFRDSLGCVFTDFRGINANEMVELRAHLKKEGVQYLVVKNTLARLACTKVGIKVDKLLEGPTGICFSKDPVLPFKLAREIAKKYEHYNIKGGIIEGEVVDKAEAERIALLPSREEILSRLVQSIQGPIWKLALSLKSIIGSLTIVLDEVRKQKEE